MNKLCLSAAEQTLVEGDVPISGAILASKSIVFRTMLSSGMAESVKDRPVVIRMSCNEGKSFSKPNAKLEVTLSSGPL